MREVLLAFFQGAVLGQGMKGTDFIGNFLKMGNNLDVNFFEKVITKKGEQLGVESFVKFIKE